MLWLIQSLIVITKHVKPGNTNINININIWFSIFYFSRQDDVIMYVCSCITDTYNTNQWSSKFGRCLWKIMATKTKYTTGNEISEIKGKTTNSPNRRWKSDTLGSYCRPVSMIRGESNPMGSYCWLVSVVGCESDPIGSYCWLVSVVGWESNPMGSYCWLVSVIGWKSNIMGSYYLLINVVGWQSDPMGNYCWLVSVVGWQSYPMGNYCWLINVVSWESDTSKYDRVWVRSHG